MINITKLNIPLNIIFSNDIFILLNVYTVKEFLDNKPTDKIIGYKYECVDTDTFEKFSVKILGQKPIISQDIIDGTENHIKVSFNDAIVKPYMIPSGGVALSFQASSIKVIQDK